MFLCVNSVPVLSFCFHIASVVLYFTTLWNGITLFISAFVTYVPNENLGYHLQEILKPHGNGEITFSKEMHIEQ